MTDSACRIERVEGLRFELAHEFSATERVLFNGWQSWTDTHEMPARSRMVGLQRTPSLVIDHWIVDAAGDYRFTDYENRLGVCHGWTYAYFTRRAGEGDQSCLLIASMDETRGFTKISMDADASLIVAEREEGAGESFKLALIEAPSVDAAFACWFQQMGVEARRASLLTGYSSWYRHYRDISQSVLETDLANLTSTFDQVDCAGHTKLFQIDDGYCLVGDWGAVDADKFPQGLAPLAEAASEAGFLPGLWMAPFVCEKDSQVAALHPEWLLRDEWGSPVTTGSHWSGQAALDTLNPQVRAYVRQCVKRAVEEWGFGLLKLDFLYAACMVPHGGMNRGQLMADAVQLLREAAGEDTLIVGCGVPLAPAFGVFDYCRIGCDVSAQWNGPLAQRLIDRERVSSKNGMANTVYRAPLCGRAFANDPDAVYLLPTSMTEDQRKQLLSAAALFGDMLLTSDDMGAWGQKQFDEFQEALFLQQAAHEERQALQSCAEPAFSQVEAFAPARTELAGNHVDHQGGVVLTGALELGMRGHAAENSQDLVRVESEGFDTVSFSLEELRANGGPREEDFGSLKALVVGMIELMEADPLAQGAQVRGFDLAIRSDIPVGGGLSSSAALELLVGNVLNTLFFGNAFGAQTLARLAQRVECAYFGKPCGLMDQMAIALGGIRMIDFADPAAPAVQAVPFSFDQAGWSVVLVDVHADHAASTDLFAQIPAGMGAVAAFFGADRLADVPYDQFKAKRAEVRAACGDVALMRALHCYREVVLVRQRAAALAAGDMGAFVQATQLSGASSAQYLQNVSAGGAQQPAMVALAYADAVLDGLAADGARPRGACRIHGGGFGGSLQAFVPADQASLFVEEMDSVLGEGSAMVLAFSKEGAWAQWR